MPKLVILASDSLSTVRKVQEAVSKLDVESACVPSDGLAKAIADHPDCDLVILDEHGSPSLRLDSEKASLGEGGAKALLAVIGKDRLEGLRLPLDIPSDFVMADASAEELSTRAGMLLWPGNEASSSDVVCVDDMTINLATYQVRIADEPIDLTYLEYALLAFLATHPGKAYSRDTLLKRVWGFDYYGGSRTIDVHVRRVRAKLGPDLAQHLETIRGVGYLWNP